MKLMLFQNIHHWERHAVLHRKSPRHTALSAMNRDLFTFTFVDIHLQLPPYYLALNAELITPLPLHCFFLKALHVQICHSRHSVKIEPCAGHRCHKVATSTSYLVLNM